MKYLKITALLLLTSFAYQTSSADTKLSFKERLTNIKDTAAQKMGAWFVFWGGQDYDAQKRRLNFYTWVEEKDWWMRHPKKWVTWIVTGKMPVKNPDRRITNEQYVDYYLVYKELRSGFPLTDKEIDDARAEAMELLDEYRRVKGVR